MAVTDGVGTDATVPSGAVFFSVPTSPKTQIVNLIGSRAVHQNGDDSTRLHLSGTYVGANHGCSDARVVPSADHGLAAADRPRLRRRHFASIGAACSAELVRRRKEPGARFAA